MTEPFLPVTFKSPHHLQGELLGAIWTHFALKRRRVFLAGSMVGAFGGLIGALKHGEHFWAPLWGGVLGFGAVGLLALVDRWQAILAADRAQGKRTAWKTTLFVVGGVLATVAATVAIAATALFFT